MCQEITRTRHADSSMADFQRFRGWLEKAMLERREQVEPERAIFRRFAALARKRLFLEGSANKKFWAKNGLFLLRQLSRGSDRDVIRKTGYFWKVGQQEILGPKSAFFSSANLAVGANGVQKIFESLLPFLEGQGRKLKLNLRNYF